MAPKSTQKDLEQKINMLEKAASETDRLKAMLQEYRENMIFLKKTPWILYIAQIVRDVLSFLILPP
jgi:hypothetical protein